MSREVALGPECLRFIDSTFSNPTAAGIARLLADESDPERDGLLELLLSPDEFAIVHKLRRVLSGLDSHQAIDLLMSQLRKTKNNYEFLVQVSKTAPGMADVD